MLIIILFVCTYLHIIIIISFLNINYKDIIFNSKSKATIFSKFVGQLFSIINIIYADLNNASKGGKKNILNIINQFINIGYKFIISIIHHINIIRK
jgi:hypothetical protein